MKALSINFHRSDKENKPLSVTIEIECQGSDKEKVDTELPFNQELSLPAVLKVLERSSFITTDFNEEELNWLLRNSLIDKVGEEFHLSNDRHKKIGNMLYKGLNKDGKLTQRLNDFNKVDEELTVELCLEHDDKLLGLVPWELLHDGNFFLFGGGKYNLYRYIELKSQRPTREIVDKLKILMISPRPLDREVEKLSNEESTKIRKALNMLEEKGQIQVDELNPPTYEEFKNYLDANSGDQMPHIIHFDGHGVFGRFCRNCRKIITSPSTKKCECGALLGNTSPQGYLAFEKDVSDISKTYVEYISAQNLANCLERSLKSDSESIKKRLCLFVLSSCESAKAVQGTSVLNGIAQRLIGIRVPAVVAMQFPIIEDAAAEFMSRFYKRIAASDPIVIAVSWGRVNLSVDDDQWYRPVLYMRWKDDEGGRFFTKTKKPEPTKCDIGEFLHMKSEEGVNQFKSISQNFIATKGKNIKAVDQNLLVDSFVFMLIPQWRDKASGHILTIQSPEGTGKTTAIDRFEYICHRVQKILPLTYYSNDLLGKKITPKSLVEDILNGIITNVRDYQDMKFDIGKLQNFYNRLVYPQYTSGQNIPQSDFIPGHLFESLYSLLNQLSEQCTIVLLFDNFQSINQLDTGILLKSRFLTKIRDGTNNIITVVASTEGLDDQEDDPGCWGIDCVSHHTSVSKIQVDELRVLAQWDPYFIDWLDDEQANKIIRRATIRGHLNVLMVLIGLENYSDGLKKRKTADKIG